MKTIYYRVVVSEDEEQDFLNAMKDLMLIYDKEFEEEEKMTTVKSQVEVLNKLIEQFEDRARWAEADGNISVEQYNNGLAEGLRRVRNGDFE